jgi:hypothetical protein
MHDGSHDPERLLRELRPEPRPDFVRALEVTLLARTRRGERFRVLVAGAASCASLVVITLALGVAGLLPWQSGAADRAKAGSDCVTETVVRHERRPVLVVTADGTIKTQQRTVAVRKPVTRCR